MDHEEKKKKRGDEKRERKDCWLCVLCFVRVKRKGNRSFWLHKHRKKRIECVEVCRRRGKKGGLARTAIQGRKKKKKYNKKTFIRGVLTAIDAVE